MAPPLVYASVFVIRCGKTSSQKVRYKCGRLHGIQQCTQQQRVSVTIDNLPHDRAHYPISGAGYTHYPWRLLDKQPSVKLLIEKGADPDVAVSGLTRNKRSDNAHMIQQMAKIAQKDKTRVAIKQGSRPSIPVSRTKENAALKSSEVVLPISKSDVDELPSMKKQTNKDAYAIVIGIEQYRQKLRCRFCGC